MTDTDDLTIEPDLDARLRRTLRAVAASVEDDQEDLPLTPLVSADGGHPGRRRPAALALVAAATVAAVGFGGWAVTRQEPAEVQVGSPRGDVVDGAPADAMMSGHAAGGGTWWLRPSTEPPIPEEACPSLSWVELGTEESHPPGWAGGLFGPLAYGAHTSTGNDLDWCRNEAVWLADPSTTLIASARTGWRDDASSDWGAVVGVHPTVTQLRVTVDGGRPFVVDTVPVPTRPDGPRYAAFTADAGATQAHVELLDADGHVVTTEDTRFGDGLVAGPDDPDADQSWSDHLVEQLEAELAAAEAARAEVAADARRAEGDGG